MRRADWARSPQPAVDARFDMSTRGVERNFRAYTLEHLPGLLDDLLRATPDLTSATGRQVARFLLAADR
ncbi:hypothetical protein [Micromonospora sp. RTP1Z1]|uniref:hypothetical protein n=1 Tax=Micromonospora sp. RTP1Z1 TaxID=2994043 RepID=UPI0029C81B81|nr:hypothetical protein [Micromonospora sp. RTP1Z1]